MGCAWRWEGEVGVGDVLIVLFLEGCGVVVCFWVVLPWTWRRSSAGRAGRLCCPCGIEALWMVVGVDRFVPVGVMKFGVLWWDSN